MDDRQLILDWLRKGVGMEAMSMTLAAGLPGGTRTQRTKNTAFAAGVSRAVTSLIRAVESGDYLPDRMGDA